MTTDNLPTAWALVVAGGHGKRMGTETPKQLLLLDGVTILERSLWPFIDCSAVAGIVISANEAVIDRCREIADKISAAAKETIVVAGGAERRDSVWNGLQALPGGAEIVAVHDAVRPFITPELVCDGIRAAAVHGAVSVMRRLKETVKVVEDGVVRSTPDREKLWITQTPQTFRTELLKRAHISARSDGIVGTDDCMLVERLGHPVRIIEGNDLNIKITTQADLSIAGALLPLFEQRGKIC